MNRFDDPRRESEDYLPYGVLYVGEARLVCFLETLARFRKTAQKGSATTQKVLENIEQIKDPNADRVGLNSGGVAQSWLAERKIGKAYVSNKKCADVYSAEGLSYLRNRFQEDAVCAKILAENEELDISDLMSQRRAISQRVGVYARDQGFDGIYSASRHGLDLINLALFAPCEMAPKTPSRLSSEDEDFQRALELLDLTLDPNS